MPLVLSPPASTEPDGTYYNETLEAAEALAATLRLSAWSDASDADKSKALEQAADRIDAKRYQGRKYEEDQERQFPRYMDGRIVDYDDEEEEAIVPTKVKKAEIYEADSILSATRDERMRAQHDNLASQSVGPMSESYHKPETQSASAAVTLCLEAERLLADYRLRTGSIQ